WEVTEATGCGDFRFGVRREEGKGGRRRFACGFQSAVVGFGGDEERLCDGCCFAGEDDRGRERPRWVVSGWEREEPVVLVFFVFRRYSSEKMKKNRRVWVLMVVAGDDYGRWWRRNGGRSA
ncbi:hypothetical protein HAX54_020959, partial [Datura stramonium]|nr:hypothetical protein [Datura stramonium]